MAKYLDLEGLSLFKDKIIEAIDASKTDSIAVSEKEGNQIIKETDGIYVAPTDLSGYVAKENGKSLISDEEISRLSSVHNYDDTTIKADIKANADAITVLNGDGETEGSVSYQINSALSGITGFDIEVVESLPETGIKGVFYLVANNGSETNNVYDEYIWASNTYEKLGTTEIDLSDYVKNTDKATSTSLGLVKVDNNTLLVDENGVISANEDVLANQDDVEFLMDYADDINNHIPDFVNYDEDELYSMVWESLSIEEKPEYTEEDLDALIDSLDLVISIPAENIPYGESNVKDALDDLSSKQVEVSKEANNQIVTKDDGLYVAPPSEISGGNTSYDNTTSGLDATTIQGAIDEIASEYVIKETGKSLMSDSEITRLSSVSNYDDTEVRGLISSNASSIETLNGNAETEGSVSYKIAQALSGFTSLELKVVEELPETGNNGVIYLISSENPGTQNIYDEYVYLESTWEKIGTTEIDLSDYAKLDDLPGAATVSDLGTVKPDDSSLTVSEDGTLSVKEVPVIELTWDEYIENKDYYDGLDTFISISDGVDLTTAAKVNFDNTNNGFVATNVQTAIEEVNSKVPTVETEDINFNIF